MIDEPNPMIRAYLESRGIELYGRRMAGAAYRKRASMTRAHAAAFRMRVAGKSYRQIGELLGVSAPRARQMVLDAAEVLDVKLRPGQLDRRSKARHGTRTMYTYGCRGDACPASPTCSEVNSEYGRKKRAERQAKKQQELREQWPGWDELSGQERFALLMGLDLPSHD
jgi:DNA-binding CsgD family transcriptional regulator